jgi:hypothetical protein
MPLVLDGDIHQEWQYLSAKLGIDSSEYPTRNCSKTEAFWQTMVEDTVATDLRGGPFWQASTEDEIYRNTLRRIDSLNMIVVLELLRSRNTWRSVSTS